MNIRDYKNCSTSGLRALDLQLIKQIQRIAPGLLEPFDQLHGIICGPGCHPYLQAPAVAALEIAIRQRGQTMTINSAYRTIAQQAILFSHFQAGRCGIGAAARPGASNHNTGLALDINDAFGWKPYLERFGWDWIGSFDPMHFDYEGAGCRDLRWISIKAFQQLWNYAHPSQRIAEDGVWGGRTYDCLMQTACSGFLSTPFKSLTLAAEPIPQLTAIAVKSLRPGAKGSDVGVLQQALNRKHFELEVDNVFGTATEAAVKAFQIQAGLVADGVVGLATKKALGLA